MYFLYFYRIPSHHRELTGMIHKLQKINQIPQFCNFYFVYFQSFHLPGPKTQRKLTLFVTSNYSTSIPILASEWMNKEVDIFQFCREVADGAYLFCFSLSTNSGRFSWRWIFNATSWLQSSTKTKKKRFKLYFTFPP